MSIATFSIRTLKKERRGPEARPLPFPRHGICFVDNHGRLVIQFHMISKEFWVFLFVLGVLLFNWPFLYMFNMVLPQYFLGVWLLFIVIMGIVVTLNDRRGGGGNV